MSNIYYYHYYYLLLLDIYGQTFWRTFLRMCDNSFTRPIAADHTPETPPNVYIRQFPQT